MALIELQAVSLDIPIYSLAARSFKKKLFFLNKPSRLSLDRGKVHVKALDNISFTLKPGARLGLIGRNSAGKSTLLRLLAGIYEPITGTVTIQGKVASLLDIELGMQEEASGLENVILCGIMLGLTKKTMQAKLAEIAEFTELDQYLLAPVHTYSTGMKLRLAFAIATSIEPEILLIDEVIGAGDGHFIHKAQKRLRSLIDQAKIVVLTTHMTTIIQEFCNQVILMDAGKIKFSGDVQLGLTLYGA